MSLWSLTFFRKRVYFFPSFKPSFCVRKCAHSCKIEKRTFSFHHCLHLRSFLCFQLFSLWLFFQKRARRLRAAIHPIITGCQVPEIPLINFTAAQNGAACTQIVYSARHPWLALETVSMACYKATAQGITSAFVFFFIAEEGSLANYLTGEL